MSRLASLFSVFGCLSLTLALGSACGGKSFTSGDDDGGSQNGGSTSGGTTSHGGSSHAGTTGKGGSSAGTGGIPQAGAGGSIGYDRCSAPPVTGQCDAAFQRWYHDPATGQCNPFLYGGCGGNDNNYESLAACQAACGGGNPTACDVPSDCAIGSISCCGVCDGPNVSPQQLQAYNKAYAGQYLCGVALDAAPAPGNIGFAGSGSGAAPIPVCPPCAAPAPGQGTLKYFVPDCVRGQCVVADLRTSPSNACMSSQECKLRNGTSCCEGCGGIDQYVGVRNDGSFEKSVCGDGPVGCPACLPEQPVNVWPYCNAGHCDVTYGMPIPL